MAQKVTTTYVDDMTGEAISEGTGGPITYALDGVTYEIDLSNKSADKFRGLFQDYIANSRRVVKSTGRTGKRTQVGPVASEIRDWARSNGHTVPDRGRIPETVRAAFNAR